MMLRSIVKSKIVHYLDYLDADHDTKLHLSHIILLFPFYSSYLSTSSLWMLISTGNLHYDWAHLSRNVNAIFLKNALVLSRYLPTLIQCLDYESPRHTYDQLKV